MAVHSPVPQDLSLWKGSSGNEVREEVLEVSAPEKNSLFWSIMLSYLIPSVKMGNFMRNMELVVGHTSEAASSLAKFGKPTSFDYGKIQKRVKNINPLKNAHSVYHDEDLSNMMRVFKLRLNRLSDKLRKGDLPYDDDLKLQAASNALECQIDVYEETSGNKQLRTYSPAIKNATPNKQIFIFKHGGADLKKAVYGIGLEEENADSMRSQALRHILRIANVHQIHINTILDLELSDRRLLLHLLKSSVKDAILTLYKSPYALRKLNDAGFDVNPLSVGYDGFSALYKCLKESKLFFTLYNYTIRDIPTEEENAMNYHEGVLLKLEAIRNTLDNDYKKVTTKFSRSTEVLLLFDQVRRFSSYQYEILKTIVSNKSDPFLPDEKHNKIIIFLLQKYDEYFYFDGRNQHESSLQLTDYVRYFDYHINLDEYTCICFLDRFLCLKTQIDEVHEAVFRDALVSLFKYLISTVIFCKSQHSANKEDVKLFIPFCYRLELKQNLMKISCKLGSVLKNGNKNHKNIVEHCLKDDPLIREEYQIARLKWYLESAIKVSFDSSPIKAALVIERTLQVIGETLSRIGDNGIVSSLLKHALPPNLVSEFRSIRNNCLSHYRASSVQGRLRLEQNKFLEKIQVELKQISDIFETIFILQTLRVQENMLTYGMQEPEVFTKHINEFREMKEVIYRFRRNFYRKHESTYISLANKTFENLLRTLKNGEIKKMEVFQSNCQCLIFLVNFIAEYSVKCPSDAFHIQLDITNKLFTKGKDGKISQQFICEILDVFSKIKSNLEDIFGDNTSLTREMKFSNLNELYETIKGHDLFNDEEKEKIRKSFVEFIEKRIEARQQLINHANKSRVLSASEINNCVKNVHVTGKTEKKIKAAINDPDALIISMSTIEFTVDDLLGDDKCMGYTFIRILNDDLYKDVIPNLCLPKSLHDKIFDLSNQKLDFLKDRMNLLEQILIDDDEHICNLRKYGTSPACKEHTKRLMKQRYMDESDTRSALEMLLFDWLNIFVDKKNFEDLWLKTSNLLSGINLRNILSHGSPVFDLAIDLLDKENLPAEFIDTILEIVKDREPFSALIDLWKEMGYPKTKVLQDLIESNVDDKYSDYRAMILKCEKRWKSYLSLLPAK